MDLDCNTYAPISVEFENGGELYPIDSYFSFGQADFDFFEAQLSSETARSLSAFQDNFYDETQYATVKIAGQPFRRMYFEPEFLRAGQAGGVDDYTGSLELHDLREQFKKGTIDFAPQKTDVENTFTEIYNHRVDEGLFNGIEINTKDGEELTPADNDEWVPIDFAHSGNGYYLQWGYSLHFNNETPLSALANAEKKHHVGTHVSPEGKFIVGSYDDVETWIVSNLESRADLHAKSASLGQTEEKIERVHVIGPTIKEFTNGPDSNRTDTLNLDRLVEYTDLNPDDDDKGGWKLHLYIENESVDSGNNITVENDQINPAFDDLESVGKYTYLAAQTESKSGSVTVDMNTSSGKTDEGELPRSPQIKDKIYYKSAECGNSAPSVSGEYYISDIQHNFNSGSWNATFGVFKVPALKSELNVRAEYYDFSENQTYTFEEIHGYPVGDRIERATIDEDVDL